MRHTRDPSNPLALPTAPGADPLNGAKFFVPGPRKGAAAGAIAQLVGLNPNTMPVNESWADFQQRLQQGSIAAKLAHNKALAHKVAELSKIASQPEVQRISIYSMGGGPGAIFGQTQKILCANATADPGSILAFNTYFLHPTLGGCANAAQIQAYMPTFKRQINEMAAAIDRRPALILAEIDALGSSACIARHGGLPAWEAALKYEVDTFQALPHTVVYVEGGYSDSNSVGYTATALNAIGVNKIAGLLHQRHPQPVDDQRDPLGDEGRQAHPRRPLHRQHRQQRPRAQAQPPPDHPGRRGSVQPARPRPRPPAQHRHRLPVRRCVHVDAPARQLQRLRRWPPRRRLLARVRHRPGRARQPAAGPRLPQPALLTRPR